MARSRRCRTCSNDLLLLLFDIDGTLLLGASTAHAASLRLALERVHHIQHPPDGRIDVAGRTDGEIARTILLLAGVPAYRIDAHARDVRTIVCREFARLCPEDMRPHLAPAAAEILQSFSTRKGIRLSLVTGNFEPVARLKLQRAGIGHFFPIGQGGFGSDDDDRAALPEIARRRAGAGRSDYPREKTFVVGDTPRDIACARADGVHVIAVASGPYPASELADADAVIETLRDLPSALRGLVTA